MHAVFNVLLKFFRAIIAVNGVLILLFFFASGHAVETRDAGQLKMFACSFVFIVEAFLLSALIKADKRGDDQVLVNSCCAGLVFCMIGLLFMLSEVLSVDYGESKPVLIFSLLWSAILVDALLLYVFIFRREVFNENG